VSDEHNAAGLRYERVVINRRLVTWAHVLLALGTALIYLSQMRRPAVYTAKYVVLLPLLPYLLSALHARNIMTPHRGRVFAFILAIALGSMLMGSVLLGAYGSVSGLILVLLFALQTIAYMGAAGVILGGE